MAASSFRLDGLLIEPPAGDDFKGGEEMERLGGTCCDLEGPH